MKIDLFKWILKYVAGCATGILLFCACSNTSVSDGGGSRGGNPVVVGTISFPDGAGASNVCVSLIDENYSPLTDTLNGYITSVTTDSFGAFSIIAPDTGWYNVEAAGSKNGTRLIRFKIKTVHDSITVLPPDTLRMPGKIKVTLPEGSNGESVYVYVPGTTIVNQISGAADTITLENVPAGVLTVLYLCQKNSTDKIAVSHDVKVISDNTTVLHNWQWSSSRQIILNTGATGAGTKENVYDFAVLIRLTSKNFDFSGAQDSGKDIRFTSADGVSLSHEIEEWDAINRTAAIWVKVDTVYGNSSTQSIMMYWGYAGAADASDSKNVFDTSKGYQGVWHFSYAAGNKVYDATVNNYTGISADTAIPQAAVGVAGKCRVFNGIDNYFYMPNTAESKLDFEENEKYPIFVWGEGACSRDGSDNSAAMAKVASYGYFVIADGTPSGGGSRNMDLATMTKPGRAYVTWIIAENRKPCSAYYQSIDTSKVAGNGFSCGGFLGQGVAGDPRRTTWGVSSSGSFGDAPDLWKSVHTPVLILEGSKDVSGPPNNGTGAYTNGLRDYNGIKDLGKPVYFISNKTMGHGGDLGNANGGQFTKINLAWLNWWLKGDTGATGRGVLAGTACKYCTDNNWEVKSANLPE